MAADITEGEAEILFVLWRQGPLSAQRLIAAVAARKPWGEATIKTLLGRLMQKNAVKSERDDGRLLYHALVSRETYLAGEIQALADRLFEGDLAALADFAETHG